ncbi:GGDEF domain-containing protein [Marinobacterium weihaiense]|uniref:Diguanylate cyclase n=1 Tax=Marinobacterium weihaiense TaxID=2851016 RepID=A0ABS6MBF3_9GAMM|nr:diguanylate cyclase [Marinobacterium weihaiense]MBV0933614.1 diguanylate cyclase [Marinobacterium weihaiense]
MAYIHYLVLPPIGEQAIAIATNAHRSHLRLTAEAIVPSLLESDLAKTYELLDAIRYDNPDWRRLELFSTDGKRLYPLALPAKASGSLMTLEEPVGFLSPPLAQLKIGVDLSRSIDMAQALESSVMKALAFLLLLIMLAVWLEVEVLIRRPLSRMVAAARRMIKGDFNAPLPARGRDEIGELAGTFADLRGTIERHHIDLAAELEAQRANALALVEAKRQAEHDATHDALTGLLNRRELERRLRIALHEAQTGIGSRHALLFMDLDHFKRVNDSCGHPAGDELLRNITAIMRRCVREDDACARMGGDEFAILLKDCERRVAVRIANDICRSIQQYRFECTGLVFHVGASIGIARLDATSTSVDQVMADADAACYEAKRRGRSRVEVAPDIQPVDA